MLKDRKIIWVIEYIFGSLLVILPFLGLILSGEKLPDPHLWTVELFTISLGVILISSASSMRQRLKLQMRIEQLTRGK
jgi:hypothetical protein